MIQAEKPFEHCRDEAGLLVVTTSGYAPPASGQSIFPKGRFMCLVYVVTPDGRPLMPCVPVIARLLLKAGKAKVVRRTPFTIKLLAPRTPRTQPLTLGVDTGSAVIGAAVADEQGKVVYLSEVELRNDIATTMKERASKRRNRRNRKPDIASRDGATGVIPSDQSASRPRCEAK